VSISPAALPRAGITGKDQEGLPMKVDFLDLIEIVICVIIGYFVRVLIDWVTPQLPFELPGVLYYLFLFGIAFSLMLLMHNQFIKRIRARKPVEEKSKE
jgi:hypothetical protein